jgi:D-3-phosphoglycerate dehydrogenase / 2-oxoglutarate reductase
MNLLVAEAKEFSPIAMRRLHMAGTVVARDLNRAELLKTVRGVDILWVRLRHRIDSEVMDAAKNLRIIVSNTTGLDHIDLDEAARRRIRVISLRGETDFLTSVRATAELTLGLILALVRHIPAAAAHTRSGGWDRTLFKGSDLFGKTAGIIGYGRLGRLVGTYLSAMGMRLLASTKAPEPIPEKGVLFVSLRQLLADADLITVHVNLTPESVKLIGATEFAAMKRGAWFVNTSRGEIVDEGALLKSLIRGQLAGAALDVLTDSYKPTKSASALRQYAAHHHNLLLTPHIGGYTHESLGKTEVFLADKLLAHLESLASESSEAV